MKKERVRTAEHREISYTLYHFFDVWKDEFDGWTVNDAHLLEENVYISPIATAKEICKYLKRKGYLNTDDLRKVYVEENGNNIEVYQRKENVPLFGFSPNF